jgi:predicted alpha/beta-fold hydrolase
MNDLKRFLEEENYSVINLALTGHHGDLPNFRKVTADQWKRDFKSGYSLARQSSNAENVPLFFVGYSLGAAVAVDLLANAKNNIHFDRMVLLVLRPFNFCRFWSSFFAV